MLIAEADVDEFVVSDDRGEGARAGVGEFPQVFAGGGAARRS